MSEQNLNSVSIYSYSDYRAYLKAAYEDKKKTTRYFSLRYFARMAGVGSSGYLVMVMNGSRNLSPESISKFAKALNLNKKETNYFESLVLFNQAKNDKERDYYFEKLKALKPLPPITKIEKDQIAFLSQKHLVIIHQMLSLPDFQDDPEWIGQRCQPPLRPEAVRQALDTLVRLKLLKRDKKGVLSQTSNSLSTEAEIDFLTSYGFHSDMLNEAKRSVIECPSQLRDITTLTVPIPFSRVREFKKKIQDFREDIMHWLDDGKYPFDEVYQLNIQLFPVTKKRSAK